MIIIETKKKIAAKGWNIFIINVKKCFDYKNYLDALHLFLCIHFPTHENNFPNENFNKTCEAYPFLNIIKLKTELKLFYKITDFHDMSSSVHLLKFIVENNLTLLLAENYKLLKIVSTISMTYS